MGFWQGPDEWLSDSLSYIHDCCLQCDLDSTPNGSNVDSLRSSEKHTIQAV